MKLVTWNCNSLGARRAFVEAYLDECGPDVLVLQELKLETHKVPVDLFEGRGYTVAVHGQKSWNGVLIASRRGMADVEAGLPSGDEGQSRFISAEIEGIRVVNVYCPQGQSADSDKFQYKLAFYDALIARLERLVSGSAPVLLMGDLNIAPAAEDLWNPDLFTGVPSFHPLEHQRLERIHRLGFVDLVKPHLAPNSYSFWDYRGAAFRFNQGMRIDHIFGTGPLAPRVDTAWISREWRKKRGDLTPSDHAPVGISLVASS